MPDHIAIVPTLLERNDIPNNRSEIPTPEATRYHAHLQHIANMIPPLDSTADILLLLDRDVLRVHKRVGEQINSPGNSPFAQKLDMGWVVVGDVCLDGLHKPPHIRGDISRKAQLERQDFGWSEQSRAVLYKCVICRKLRGKTECQQMGKLTTRSNASSTPLHIRGC